MALHWLSSSSSPPLCLAAVICSVMCLFWFELQKAAVYLQFLASQLMLQQKYFAQNRTLVLDVSAGSYFHFTNSAFSFTVTSIIGNSQMLWVFSVFAHFFTFYYSSLPRRRSVYVACACTLTVSFFSLEIRANFQ